MLPVGQRAGRNQKDDGRKYREHDCQGEAHGDEEAAAARECGADPNDGSVRQVVWMAHSPREGGGHPSRRILPSAALPTTQTVIVVVTHHR